jgi:hypothetical protein
VGACAAVVLAGAVGAAPNRPAPTAAGNARAARLDADQLLGSLRLPAGATSLSAEPPGDGGALQPMPGLTGTEARADTHAWWKAPGTPDSVLGHVEADPPAGSTQASVETSYDGPTGTGLWSVTFTWPPVAGVLGSRELEVSFTSLPGNVTGVLAQAESDWIVPRTPGEQIPRGVREVQITTAKLHGPRTLSLTATNPGQVRRLIALFDAMPVVQPAAYSCPAALIDGARVMTFKFRAGAGAPVLAQATYTDYPPLGSPSGPCKPVEFAVRGRSEAPLIGGDFVAQVERIVGARLTSG